MSQNSKRKRLTQRRRDAKKGNKLLYNVFGYLEKYEDFA